MKNLAKTILTLSLVSILVFASTACASLQGSYDCLLVYGAPAVSASPINKIIVIKDDKLYIEDQYVGTLLDSTADCYVWSDDKVYPEQSASKLPLSDYQTQKNGKAVFVKSDDPDVSDAIYFFVKVKGRYAMLFCVDGQVYTVFDLERV